MIAELILNIFFELNETRERKKARFVSVCVCVCVCVSMTCPHNSKKVAIVTYENTSQ